jgi:putative heme transporter
MITQRSHQYLPRAGRDCLRVSLAGASWDTPNRVEGGAANPGIRGHDNAGRYATGMPAGPSVDSVADESVTPLVRKTAAWAWRLLVILAAVVALLWLIKRLEVIVVPVALATILTALLLPAVDFLDRRGAPRGGAVALVLLSGIAVVGGILAFVISQFIEGLPGLVEQVTRSVDGVRNWLISGPLRLSREQIDQAGNATIEALRNNQERLTSGALSTAGTITEIVTGALLVLFTLIFLLLGGRNIFAFATLVFPDNVRDRVRDAGRAGFRSLIGYVRATFLVALVDAVGIGTGLAIMGVPLALPLASLVFLGAFVPLVGAVVTGFLAVIVALIAKGIVYALITLGLIIAVQQLEGHVLQPLVMGRAVSIHPLAIVLAIAGGAVLAGIVGALLAVPTVAILNSAVRVLLAREPAVEEAEQEAEEGPMVKAETDEPN